MASVDIRDELKDFAQAQAAKRGLASASEYVETLLKNAKQQEESRDAGLSQARSVAAAIAELNQLRIGNRLNGVSIRSLVEEGRRL